MFFNDKNEQIYASLTEKIRALIAERGSITVAIDGPCTSGKSTLAEKLARDFEGESSIFHIDDFSLRDEQATPERLAVPGGNIDYERFTLELLEPLKAKKPFLYRPFDWQTRDFAAAKEGIPARLNIVEGVYCLHEKMRDYYDLKIFVRTDMDKRIERLIARNGEGMIDIFKEKWIPLEELYFSGMNPESVCEFVFET